MLVVGEMASESAEAAVTRAGGRHEGWMEEAEEEEHDAVELTAMGPVEDWRVVAREDTGERQLVVVVGSDEGEEREERV